MGFPDLQKADEWVLENLDSGQDCPQRMLGFLTFSF